MNILLLFFALPIAVIIFSIVLQKILKCPILVAGVIFAIFLILSFTVFSVVFLVATIIYTLISFITATIVSLIERFNRCIRDRICPDDSNHCTSNNSNDLNTSNLLTIQSRCGVDENRCENGNGCGNSNGNLLTISSSCNNGENSNDLLTIRSDLNNTNTSNNRSSSCNCNCTCRRNGTIAVNASVVPQNNTSGTFSGCYRRRCR